MSGGTAPGARRSRLEVVSDIVCPWCYIGKRRLERGLELLTGGPTVEVHWLPYELNPTMPAEGMDRDAYCVRKFGSIEYARQLYDRVTDNARGDGLPMDYHLVTRIPNTRNAHRLIWLAGECGVQDAVVDALFAAYFVAGRDIAAPAVLAEVGVGAGLDGERVARMLAADEALDVVRAQEARAHELGIDGVPAFLLDGRYLFSGAQVPETIALAIRQAVARRS